MKAATLALCLLAVPAMAAPDAPEATARAALQSLRDAGAALVAAHSRHNRVAALTKAIRAYETGLSALREGLRQTAVREAALRGGLDAESGQLARLLGVLETVQPGSADLFFVHPGGPQAAVEAGQVIAGLTPALARRVAALRKRLDALHDLERLQTEARDSLVQGLTGVQEARTELAGAISTRAPLPSRFAADDQKLAMLAKGARSLAGFADALEAAGLPAGEEAGAIGPWALPVEGTLRRRYGERDAAGIARPGWVIATEARALVTTPVRATVRYAGPLLDYKNVMILEPAPHILLVLAGLDTVYATAGSIVPAGDPVGLMGGKVPTVDPAFAQLGGKAGAERTETLYLEVRQNGRPVDPAGWFGSTKDATK